MALTSVTDVSASGIQTAGRDEFTVGGRRAGLYRITLGNPYATGGGDPFDPRQFGFQGPVGTVLLAVRSNGASTLGRYFQYDTANKKIVAIAAAAGIEAGAVNLSGVVIDVLVLSGD
jgi:hypothetical protein